jgi:hypothetical protein
LEIFRQKLSQGKFFTHNQAHLCQFLGKSELSIKKDTKRSSSKRSLTKSLTEKQKNLNFDPVKVSKNQTKAFKALPSAFS